ncbi:hypothetical protein AOQ84DRAFT_113159 [Glonium stellatum]|uniref:BYS1 domain protein n=1 Tax=Glonium stellatum TaxID=574774 RepID=A0A8E2JPJ5_9PEZI|nr:hypothetical protein AOQ84DRAFT_113159 [Glonium stellatum]
MHFTSLTIAALATLTPLAHAVGNATVYNKCTSNVYVWSVGGSIGPEQTLGQGQEYTEAYHIDPVSGGIAIKVTRTSDGLYSGAPQTIFSYTLQNGGVWYDLSDVFGDAFSGSHIEVVPSDSGCQSIDWTTGTSPGGSQVKVCESGTSLTLTLCA